MSVLYLFDVPTLSDDMVYRFMWNNDEGEVVRRIHSLGNLIDSQYTHYLIVNGRAIVHGTAQFFFVFIPPLVLKFINALLFVALIHFIVRYVNRRAQRMFLAMSAFFLLFVVFSGFRTAILWSIGSFNYLWVLTFTLLFLLWLRHIFNRSITWIDIIFSPLALIIGWSHEALSLPLSIAFTAFLIKNHKGILHRAVLPYILWFMAGTALCLLSPGIWNRSGDAQSLQFRLLIGVTNMIMNIRVLWLLLLVMIILWRRQRSRLKNYLLRYAYGYIALLFSVVIVLLCGSNLERVGFYTDFIAMLLLLPIMTDILSVKWRKRITVICIVVSLLCYIPASFARQENSLNWTFAKYQMKKPGQELIAVRCPLQGENVMMDYFRNRYVMPSFEFGFYSCYMGFDSNDYNIRCAAKMFDKEKLVFLPDDVVKRIENDSTAYQTYELDANKSLYVWQMKDDTPIEKVTFILKDEDTSSLLPHQRLLSYHGDRYELDNFHYELITVHDKHYLVFTRPTTNIYRRIDHIEVTYSNSLTK